MSGIRIRDKELKDLDHAFHIAWIAEANAEDRLNAELLDGTDRSDVARLLFLIC